MDHERDAFGSGSESAGKRRDPGLRIGLGWRGVSDGARARATGVWAAALGTGAAVGPLLAAALLRVGGWQASYWAIAAISLLLALFGLLKLPKDRAAAGVDVPGTISLVAGLACLLSGLTEIRRGLSPMVLALSGASLVLSSAFVWIELTCPDLSIQS